MAYRQWKLDLDHGTCTVELKHNYWTTYQTVWVDGNLMVDTLPFSTLENRHEFVYNRHHLQVIVGRRWMTLQVKYTLTVDGNVIRPFQDR